jgi:hypothetical protein
MRLLRSPPAQAPVLTLPAPEPPAEARPIVAGAGVSIDFEWTIVGLVTMDSGDCLVFPLVPTSPGMYRFRWTQSKDSHIYVGEASDLRRRFGNYRNPGATQATNTRMNERLRPLVRSGVSVEVATATSVVLHIDGEPTVADLAWRPRRLLAENAALIRACADGSAKVFNL